jgi:hypothetical protein
MSYDTGYLAGQHDAEKLAAKRIHALEAELAEITDCKQQADLEIHHLRAELAVQKNEVDALKPVEQALRHLLMTGEAVLPRAYKDEAKKALKNLDTAAQLDEARVEAAALRADLGRYDAAINEMRGNQNSDPDVWMANIQNLFIVQKARLSGGATAKANDKGGSASPGVQAKSDAGIKGPAGTPSNSPAAASAPCQGCDDQEAIAQGDYVRRAIRHNHPPKGA